jgi:hypothetical protein
VAAVDERSCVSAPKWHPCKIPPSSIYVLFQWLALYSGGVPLGR